MTTWAALITALVLRASRDPLPFLHYHQSKIEWSVPATVTPSDSFIKSTVEVTPNGQRDTK